MINGFAIWRQRIKLWLPPLLLVLANLALLSAYRLVYAGQAQLRSLRVERSSAELTALEGRRQELEALVGRVQSTRSSMRRLYRRKLASESQRLTSVIAEVKQLAATSGLAPANISYDSEELEEHDLRMRSLTFTVQGSYQALRQLINLLEVSDSFLVLEQVALSGGEDNAAALRINLRITTLFALPTARTGGRPRESRTGG